MSLSEIRVNTTKTRTGVGTITYTETGPVITGIATASNFKTGSTNVHSTGVELANINTGGSTATFGGPISGTSATLSGALSGTTASFSGNVSVGGTLTYEDVTNIDSVGIVTARDGLKVLGGGANVAGVTTFSDAVRIVKTAGPLLELTTNTGAADATLRLSEGATGSTTNGGGMYYSGADNKLHITCGTNSTTKRITINRDDGKVGIGTNSQSFFTHIQGDGVTNDVLKITARGSGQMVNIQNHSNVPSIVRFSNYLGNAFWDAQYNTDNSFSLDYQDGEKFHITSGGSVNIGGDYTQTSKKFKVTGNSTFDGGLLVTGLLEGGSGFSIANGNLTLPAYTYHDGDSDTYYGFSSANQFSVFTAGDQRFKIESTGRILATTDESTTGLIIQNTVHDSQLRIEASAANKNSVIQFADGADGDVGIIDYDHNDNSLAVTVNTNERLRIDSNGMIGIGGVTPKTQNTFDAIEFGKTGFLGSQTGARTVEMASNAYYNSGWKYKENDVASQYYQYQGYHAFTSAVSGSADGAITFVERLRIQSDGNVGIARTFNNAQTSSKSSLYDLSINRECSANTYDGLNRSLNVDNQYTVETFRAPNINRSSTTGWMDVTHFRAWDINAKVIIQAGGTFTGDQVDIRVISSYNSALANSRSGPILEVRRTEGHNGGRFTKVRIGCHNSNRQPILQVYFDGGAVHNALGSITVTCHDYGSNYGHSVYRGEPKFATATTLNETWEELDIDGNSCDYFNTSTTPAFSAFKYDNSNQISSGVYTFNSQTLDRGGDNYSTSNGKYTAPCDGVYYFIATLQMYGDNGSGTHARFQKNGTDIYNNGTNTPSYDEKAGNHQSLTMFCLVELSTDDYVECVRNNTTRGMQSAIAGFLVR